MKQQYTIWIAECYSCQKDVIQLLKKSNLSDSMKIIASHSLGRPELEMHADHFERQPPIRQSAAWLLEQCIQHQVDLLFCGKHAHFIEAHREEFQKNNIQLITGAIGAAQHAAVNDKYRFTQQCEAIGLPHIPCAKVSNAAELTAAIQQYQALYPQICAKPVHGVYGAGFVQLQDDADYFKKFQISSICNTRQFIEAYGQLNPAIDYLIMPYLDGQECSVDIACDAGKILAQVTRTKHKFFQVCDLAHPCHAICSALVAHFQCDGLINIQFKQDSNLNWRILEINPRPAGGFAYTQHTGVNLMAELIAHKLSLTLIRAKASSPVRVIPVEQSIKMESDCL